MSCWLLAVFAISAAAIRTEAARIEIRSGTTATPGSNVELDWFLDPPTTASTSDWIGMYLPSDCSSSSSALSTNSGAPPPPPQGSCAEDKFLVGVYVSMAAGGAPLQQGHSSVWLAPDLTTLVNQSVGFYYFPNDGYQYVARSTITVLIVDGSASSDALDFWVLDVIKASVWIAQWTFAGSNSGTVLRWNTTAARDASAHSAQMARDVIAIVPLGSRNVTHDAHIVVPATGGLVGASPTLLIRPDFLSLDNNNPSMRWYRAHYISAGVSRSRSPLMEFVNLQSIATGRSGAFGIVFRLPAISGAYDRLNLFLNFPVDIVLVENATQIHLQLFWEHLSVPSGAPVGGTLNNTWTFLGEDDAATTTTTWWDADASVAVAAHEWIRSPDLSSVLRAFWNGSVPVVLQLQLYWDSTEVKTGYSSTIPIEALLQWNTALEEQAAPEGGATRARPMALDTSADGMAAKQWMNQFDLVDDAWPACLKAQLSRAASVQHSESTSSAHESATADERDRLMTTMQYAWLSLWGGGAQVNSGATGWTLAVTQPQRQQNCLCVVTEWTPPQYDQPGRCVVLLGADSAGQRSVSGLALDARIQLVTLGEECFGGGGDGLRFRAALEWGSPSKYIVSLIIIGALIGGCLCATACIFGDWARHNCPPGRKPAHEVSQHWPPWCTLVCWWCWRAQVRLRLREAVVNRANGGDGKEEEEPENRFVELDMDDDDEGHDVLDYFDRNARPQYVRKSAARRAWTRLRRWFNARLGRRDMSAFEHWHQLSLPSSDQ
jgi:hypothetical protein